MATLLQDECGLREIPTGEGRLVCFELRFEVVFRIVGEVSDDPRSEIPGEELPEGQRVKFSELFFFDNNKARERSVQALRAVRFNGDFEAPAFDLPDWYAFFAYLKRGERGGLRWTARGKPPRPAAPDDAVSKWKHAWGIKKSRDAQIMPLDDE